MKHRTRTFFYLILCSLLMLPGVLHAEDGGVSLTNPLGTSDVREIIGNIISAALGLVGSIALLMIIYGGFLWLTAGGNTERITKGKNVLIWSVIGLAVIFFAYSITNFVVSSLS